LSKRWVRQSLTVTAVIGGAALGSVADNLIGLLGERSWVLWLGLLVLVLLVFLGAAWGLARAYLRPVDYTPTSGTPKPRQLLVLILSVCRMVPERTEDGTGWMLHDEHGGTVEFHDIDAAVENCKN